MKKVLLSIIFFIFSSCTAISDYLPQEYQTNQGKQRATGPDSIAPTVNISYPIFAQKVGAICQFIGTAIDTNSGVDKVFVRFDDGAFQRIKCNDGIWITNIEIEGYGLHTNYVYAIDVSNNVSITNQVVFYRAPVPSVIITSHSCFDYTNVERVRVYGNCAIDYPFAISNIQISVNGAEYVDVIMTNSWQYDWLIEGVTLQNSRTNYILARAIGNNGTTNLSSVVFLWLEKNKPFVSIEGIEDTVSIFSANKFFVNGKATDNGETGIKAIYLKLNNAAYSPVIGTTEWFTNIALYGITNTVKVYSVDFCGNISTTKTFSIIQLDTNNPTVSIINAVDNQDIFTKTYRLFGTSDDGNGTGVKSLWISVNGSVYKRLKNTSFWSTNIYTIYGTNVISVYGDDFYSHRSQTNTIHLILVRPTIIFDVLTNYVVYEGSNYTISGTSYDINNQVKESWININNTGYKKLSGTSVWSTNIFLNNGTNTISAYTINQSGYVSYVEKKIIYKKYWKKIFQSDDSVTKCSIYSSGYVVYYACVSSINNMIALYQYNNNVSQPYTGIISDALSLYYSPKTGQ